MMDSLSLTGFMAGNMREVTDRRVITREELRRFGHMMFDRGFEAGYELALKIGRCADELDTEKSTTAGTVLGGEGGECGR